MRVTHKEKMARMKTKPCCEVVAASESKSGEGVEFPAVQVSSMAENRSEFEARLAWLFEFRATYRDGRKKFLAWKVMGLAGDKEIVYERLRRRADGENIILIEIVSVSAAMTDEQVEMIREINRELAQASAKTL